MHAVIGPDEYRLAPSNLYAGHSVGYLHASLIDERHGSVHTGLSLNELAPRGEIRAHVHSFEEGFYLLNGSADIRIGDRTATCSAGDFAVAKVGVPHSWYNPHDEPVRWLQMSAPQPKPAGGIRDTFFSSDLSNVLRQAAPKTREKDSVVSGAWGHFDVSQIPPIGDRPASVGQGVFLKWLIDESFGAVHHRLLFIEYPPGANIPLHDHTFEESYFILSGEVEATLDGRTCRAGAGTVLWTGVGCVHAFANVGKTPVRWLETFAPQPPKENVFRFVAEWERRGAELESESVSHNS
jgi:quercetin dioxygenase-like cupin family protein